nr:reverse transcriptase domain-containing protein [Tanacetum cinerariifolium]
MLKALLSNKEKLLELENTPLNENCSVVILKRLLDKLGDPRKFLIPYGFSELKCKALADLGASINLMPLSVWKKLEMILRDGDKRLTLNMRHDTLSYSNQPQKESINMINIYDDSHEDYLEDMFATNHLSGNLTFSSHLDLTSPEVINPLSGSATSFSLNHLLEEFADELALITFPSRNDDLPFDIESDIRELEYFLNHGSGHLPSNTIANPKGELKAITTQSGIVLNGPSVPIPPLFVNLEEDERVDETSTDQDLAELKALLSNKEKLLELANTPLNENCSVVILKNLHEKLGDPEKFLILCGFSELKCKALADLEGSNVLTEKFLDLDSTKDLHPPHNVNPLIGSTTSSSPNHLLEEFTDELALITFPPRNNDLPFDIESDLKEIEDLLNNDPIKEMNFILKDSIHQSNLTDLNDNLVDTMPEMFTDKHVLDYSSPPLYDEYDDDIFEVESNTEYVYDDHFDSKGEKIKESKLLIDELDLPSDFLPSSEYDSFIFEDFSKVDVLPSTNNEEKVFNPGILIQENLFEVITRVAPDKNAKKLAISHASLILEDFDPPLYELSFFKEVPGVETLLSFSIENEEKVFKPGILTSKGVHSSFIP